jgi:hypothetical protein
MAKVILGIGTSHTPMLTLAADDWEHRASADLANPRLSLSDGRWLSYEELRGEVGDRYAAAARPEVLRQHADTCERALDRLAGLLAEAAPDVVIIVGDDQEELFTFGVNPALAIFHGDTILTSAKFGGADQPEWMRKMSVGYAMNAVHAFAGAPEFACDLIVGLMERHIDVTAVASVERPDAAGFGHAFGFVIHRLFAGRRIPVVPVLLNTYFPPNVPTAARSHDIGRALREAIDSSRASHRVAIVASGGLSHFVVDEDLDRLVLEGVHPGQAHLLRSIPRCALNSGSSEILNWILMAGALDGLPLQYLEYQPIYRSAAGTGVGVAFAAWCESAT